MNKVYFIGAGAGDPELITLKGYKRLSVCQTVIYAGSLVNKEILQYAPKDADIYDSASMDLDEIVSAMKSAIDKGHDVARVHTGDPSLYGAILEQMEKLDVYGIEYEQIPGVTALFAAAAALKCELTLPEISQTVIISRYAGRTKVPESFADIAKVRGTLALYLSVSQIATVVSDLVENGLAIDTPVAVVYKASWADEKIIKGELHNIADIVAKSGISNHALIIVGEVLRRTLKEPSKLYDAGFTHMFRESK